MDPSEVDPEMAAFMGFSNFGTQPAAKKRKYNHRADTVSDTTASAAAATGANQVAVAPRKPSAPPAPAAGDNADEIDLDSDNDGPAAAAAAAADAVAGDDAPDDEDGGASLYADRTVAPALAHAQELIDEMTTRGGVASGPSAPQAQSGGGSHMTSLPSLPIRPDASWGREMGAPPVSMPGRDHAGSGSPPASAGGGRGGRHQHQHSNNRPDGKPWWEGYYDPKSNENPWDRLERAAGVESRGTWVSRASQAQSA